MLNFNTKSFADVEAILLEKHLVKSDVPSSESDSSIRVIWRWVDLALLIPKPVHKNDD